MAEIYKYLESIGYDHPLHPPMVHMPTGLVIGAFLFIIAAIIFRRPDMRKTAAHCTVLALIFTVPSVFLGVTDWQHYYASTWSATIIIKFALTAVLTVLLILGIILSFRKTTGYAVLLLIYFLMAATVGGLGYYGAQLVYAERAPVDGDLKKGEQLYTVNCGGCHPNGGNTINPGLPVVNSSKVKNVSTFINFNRNPVKADGSRGTMPAFPKERLSDDDLKQIYQYVTAVLEKQRAK